jgi:hypothetical protein
MANSIHTAEKKGNQAMDKAKEVGQDAMHKAKDVGQDAMQKAKEVGSEAVDKAKEVGGQAIDKAKEAATAVGGMAMDTASAAGHKADDLTSAAGHQIREFADSMEKRMPHEGIAGKASQVMTDTLKEGGRYIEEAKLSGMAKDVENVVKNHPIPALLLVFGIGFCLGRVMKD